MHVPPTVEIYALEVGRVLTVNLCIWFDTFFTPSGKMSFLFLTWGACSLEFALTYDWSSLIYPMCVVDSSLNTHLEGSERKFLYFLTWFYIKDSKTIEKKFCQLIHVVKLSLWYSKMKAAHCISICYAIVVHPAKESLFQKKNSTILRT